jgi:DNA/RNA-binding domain of Phe-tRNA-synthetase-like protein
MGKENQRPTEITLSPEICAVFPDLAIGFLEGPITNSIHDPELWTLVGKASTEIAGTMDAEKIRQVEGIRLGKAAYRRLGKDPNRYRLSAEALMRRIVKGQDLYTINTCVDVLNLVSLRTGVTIGGFDRDLVQYPVELGIGRFQEEFEAIGRGNLNVESLPVYRDRSGTIGNPTSDCTRTQITVDTKNILMLITGFYGIGGINGTLEMLDNLLKRFCGGHRLTTGIISNKK